MVHTVAWTLYVSADFTYSPLRVVYIGTLVTSPRSIHILCLTTRIVARHVTRGHHPDLAYCCRRGLVHTTCKKKNQLVNKGLNTIKLLLIIIIQRVRLVKYFLFQLHLKVIGFF